MNHTTHVSIARASLTLSACLFASFALVACDSSSTTTATTTSTSTATSSGTTSSTSASGSTSSGTASSGSGTGGGPSDPCGDALLCETFDNYAGTTAIADKQALGFWSAAVESNGGAMDLDSTHVVSGTKALHIKIDKDATAGGRLFANGDLPLFKDHPQHLYGRMQMYIDPNGPSIHWTFFGASGLVDPTTPVAGRRATYLMSSLPKNDVNTFSFVYGLESSGSDPYHDCYDQSPTPMPSPGWTCVQFDLDGANRKLSMRINGQSTDAGSVDDHGQGCVGNVPGDSPWYGPQVDEVYVGAWSFHPMVSPLEVWIDDLVVDTKPVICPAP